MYSVHDKHKCKSKCCRGPRGIRGRIGPTGPTGAGSDYRWRIAVSTGPTAAPPYVFGPADVNNNDLVVFYSAGGIAVQGDTGSAIVSLTPNNIFEMTGPPPLGFTPDDPTIPNLYIDSTTNEIYVWNDGVFNWNPSSSETGPTGPTGSVGSTGSTGPTGSVAAGSSTDKQILFNNAGAVSGNNNLLYDVTNNNTLFYNATTTATEHVGIGKGDCNGIGTIALSAVKSTSSPPSFAPGDESILIHSRNNGIIGGGIVFSEGASATRQTMTTEAHNGNLSLTYTPVTPSDWSFTGVPTSVCGALDKLASVDNAGTSGFAVTPVAGWTIPPDTVVGYWSVANNILTFSALIYNASSNMTFTAGATVSFFLQLPKVSVATGLNKIAASIVAREATLAGQSGTMNEVIVSSTTPLKHSGVGTIVNDLSANQYRNIIVNGMYQIA